MALFILPYLIIKIIIQNISTEIIDQIFEELMSVIQLNQLTKCSASGLTPNTNNSSILSSTLNLNSNSSKILEYQHICCQTAFNIYDHLMRQLNYYREKVTDLQATMNAKYVG